MLYDERNSTSAMVTRNKSWPDLAKIKRNKASRLTLLRANITFAIYHQRHYLHRAIQQGRTHISHSYSCSKRNWTLAETPTCLLEASLLTLAFGMIQVDYAFLQDLAAKVSPYDVSHLRMKNYRLQPIYHCLACLVVDRPGNPLDAASPCQASVTGY